jgi:hypothetical protein
MGIPTFVVNREGFASVVDNAFASLGFSAEAAKHVFPQEMFLRGSDLSPIEKNLDKIIDGLTKWQPKVKEKTLITPPKIMVTGKDYEEAVTNMNNLFLKNLWSDGLPLLPPTRERVKWILTGTDLSPDTIIGEGKILPRGGITSVESLAVNLAMAGGRPEYLPVLIAAVEAMINPLTRHQAWTATTGCTAPMTVVNGPVAEQVRINRGYGCLGPSSEYPAGGCIGRAIRLLLTNLGGAIPGKGTMSIYGGPGRYSSLLFAEDEDGLPADWEPLNVEQGYKRGSNTLTFDVAYLYGEVWEGVAMTEEELDGNLKSMARFIGSTLHLPSSKTAGYLLIGRSSAQQLSKLGWSKAKVQSFLWEHARIEEPLSQDLKEMMKMGRGIENVQWPVPISQSPENIKIVVCGGLQSGHSYWIQSGGGHPKGAANAEIKLPANWDQLLKKAEEDLGPVPTAN